MKTEVRKQTVFTPGLWEIRITDNSKEWCRSQIIDKRKTVCAALLDLAVHKCNRKLLIIHPRNTRRTLSYLNCTVIRNILEITRTSAVSEECNVTLHFPTQFPQQPWINQRWDKLSEGMYTSFMRGLHRSIRRSVRAKTEPSILNRACAVSC